MAALRLTDPAPIVRLRLIVFDTYQRLQPRVYDPELPVRIIDVDDESIRAIGQWPWSRTVLARLTERLTELGASAIAYDIVLAGPAAVWRGILAAVPVPFYQDFWSARFMHGFRTEGDLDALCAYYAAVRRLGDLLRQQANHQG